ncbi:MAG: DUF6458 family protein [Geodermatophilaceae bacterium]|jgi:hypothetical protein|nr:hypothetical protein [Geodermatophilaceae bacterium]
MGVGISIFLLALGAILAFAIDSDVVDGINLGIVGFVLMAVGVIGIIISLVLMNQRSNTSHRVVEERRYRDDGTLY